MNMNDADSIAGALPDPHGIVMLDRAQRVVSANGFARHLIESGGAFCVPSNATPRPGQPRVFRLRAPCSLLAAAIPLPAPFDQDLDSVVLLWDPYQVRVCGAELAREAFGLTHAEADVALDLYAGRTPREIAERRGRTIHTIRTLLARTYSKCAVRRQAELVRLLGGIVHVNGMIEGIEAAFHAAAVRCTQAAVANAAHGLERLDVHAQLVHWKRGRANPFHLHTHGHEIICTLEGTLTTEYLDRLADTARGEAHHIPSGIVHRGVNRDAHADASFLWVTLSSGHRPFRADVSIRQ